MPKKYTITEAAEQLGITRAAVHLAIQKKKLRAKWGTVTQKALLIDSKDLDAYKVDLARQRSGKKTNELDRYQANVLGLGISPPHGVPYGRIRTDSPLY
jgi:hypothetical protein